MSSVCLATAARGRLQVTDFIRLLLWCGQAWQLQRTTRGHFDPHLLESTEVSVIPAEVVDAKTGAEESLFVFPVAQGVVVTRSEVCRCVQELVVGLGGGLHRDPHFKPVFGDTRCAFHPQQWSLPFALAYRGILASPRAHKIGSAWAPPRTCLRELRREMSLKHLRSSSANHAGVWTSQSGILSRLAEFPRNLVVLLRWMCPSVDIRLR